MTIFLEISIFTQKNGPKSLALMDKKKKALIDSMAAKRKNSLSRHFYIAYWHMQEWLRKKWAEDGWSEITMDHVKLISLISGGEQMSNSELAQKAGVTKQAMSQMVTLLEKRDVLIVEQDPNDSRAKLISLSDYGVEFMVYFTTCSEELTKYYTKILGAEKVKLLIELTGELANGIMETDPIGKHFNIKK